MLPLDTASLRHDVDARMADATARGHDVAHLAPRPDDDAIVLERTLALLGRRYAGSPRAADRPARRHLLAATATAVVALSVPLLGGTAGAVAVTDDASFRAAWIDPGVVEIVLAADVSLACTGTPTRGAAPVTVIGQGHTITNACAAQDALRIGDAPLDLLDLVIDGAGTGDDGVQATSDVDLTAVVVERNTGRAVEADGQVDLRGSAIRDNHDGIYAEGRLYARDSSFTGQVLRGGYSLDGITLGRVTAADNGGAAFTSAGDVLIDYSAVYGNNEGVVATGEVEAFNTTVVDHAGHGIWSETGIELYHATVTGNAYNVGGPVDLWTEWSVLADAGVTSCNPNLASVTSTYTYSDDASCGLTGVGDRQGIGIESSLGPLADNGGPTLTRLPDADGVLVDRIPAGDCAAIDDQRGQVRPAGDGCDVGAVERPVAAASQSTQPSGSAGAGSAAGPGDALPATAVSASPTYAG
jgi:hypothetical protein